LHAIILFTSLIFALMPTSSLPLFDRALVWFRRDLRVEDNAALCRALNSARQVMCVFVFDRAILDRLPRQDRRVEFIRDSVAELNESLGALAATYGQTGVRLIVRHGHAVETILQLAQQLQVQAVFANHDDEPAALARDAAVRHELSLQNRAWHSTKDHVVFERSELLTGAGKPYSVFTPYKNAWLKKWRSSDTQPHDTAMQAHRLIAVDESLAPHVPSLAELGFEPTNLRELKVTPGTQGAQQLLAQFKTRMAGYEEARNFPAIKGPSYLSVHLRFGTVSIRELVRAALDPNTQSATPHSRGAEVWLSELIWRDFYHQVLHHSPHVVNASFKPSYDAIQWEQGPQAEALFDAWSHGQTGYPLVDAAMAQINQTGYMHNRLRMVTASFLVKDLGLDWRWGERYFAQALIDFDLAANNGGWQWAASTGCDAQPYFRIFNPVSQSEKFDAAGQFIRRYVPALAELPNASIHAPWQARPLELQAAGVYLGHNYPAPLVRHDEARLRTLKRYGVVKPGASIR
jgi:deoxyribodipyrimidine photo-lyase